MGASIVGAAAFVAIASISARWRAMATSNAGAKCDVATRANGGVPNGVSHS